MRATSHFKWLQLTVAILIIFTLACSSKKAGIDREAITSRDVGLRILLQNVAENPDDPDVHFQLAKAYFDLDSLDLAGQEVQKTLQLKKDKIAARLLLAKIELRQDSVKAAYKNFLEILDSDSGDVYVKKVAYAFGKPYKIYQLTKGDFNNAFPYPSPDDQRLVFQSDRDGNWEIYMSDVDGESVVRLTNDEAADEMPVFSEEGEVIAYTSTKDDTLAKSRLGRNRNIFLMDLQSGKTVRETSHTADDWYPALAGDKWLLVFASERDDPRDVPFQEKFSDIYLKDLHDGTILRLTQNEADDGSPSFSSDKKWILFTSNRTGSFQIYRMDRKGVSAEQLTDLKGNCGAPHFSHDNKMITFFSNHLGNYDIYLMTARGENLVRLTNDPASDVYPVFSPDKRKIFFHSNRTGKYQIYWIDLMTPLNREELISEIEKNIIEFTN